MADNPQVSNPDIFNNASGNEVLGAGIAVIPVSLLAVGLRFWARRYRKHELSWNDWLVLPVLAGNIALSAVTIWTFRMQAAGFVTPQAPPGTNALDFQDIKISTGKMTTWSIEIIQCWTLTCTKLSLLHLYRKVFYTGHKGAFHFTSIALMIISLLWGITFFLGFLLQCGTNLYAWYTNIRLLNEYCKASLPLEISFAVTDISVDLAMFFLPLIMVVKLKINKKRKFATASIFGLGAFAIVAGLFRMAVMVEAVVIVTSAYTKTKTGATNGPVAAHAFWASIESSATLLAACLPVIYAPLRDTVKRRLVPNMHCPQPYERSDRPSNTRRWPFDRVSPRDAADTGFSMTVDSIPMINSGFSAAKTKSTAVASEEVDPDATTPPSGQIRVEHTIIQTSTSLRNTELA